MDVPFLCVIDDEGNEIPGSRRTVDFEHDREGYFRAKAELERAAGENCRVFDSEIDGQ